MPVPEAFGATLASITFLAFVYEKCKMAYNGCEKMCHFGEDFRSLWLKLLCQKVNLDALMVMKVEDMLEPLDPNNAEQEGSRNVLRHLNIIETHFRKCNEIVQSSLGQSGLGVLDLDIGDDETPATSLPSLMMTPATATSQSGVQTPQDTQQHSEGPNAIELADLSTARKGGKKNKLRAMIRGHKHRDKVNASISPQDHDTVAGAEHIPDASSSGALPSGQIRLPSTLVEPAARTAFQFKRIQSRTSLWGHVKWADHGKEDFTRLIDDIRNAIADLALYVTLKAPAHTQRNVKFDNALPLDAYSTLDTRQALARAHESLRGVNAASQRRRKFSFYIGSGPDMNWDALRTYNGLALRPGAIAMFLQSDCIDRSGSTCFALETMSTPDTAEDRDLDLERTKRLNNLDRLDIYDPTLHATHPFALFGNIVTPNQALDIHNVFVEEEKWQKIKTLTDYLGDENFREDLSLSALIDLVRRMVIAYLDLDSIRDSCDGPRIEDYLFYEAPTYEDDPDDTLAEGPAWSRPYWDCGFGRPPRRLRAGATRPEPTNPDSGAMKLGLVIFQLGTYSTAVLDVQPGQKGPITSTRAKQNASSRMGDLQRAYGPEFADIVERCLEATSENEIEILCGCLTRLDELKRFVGER